MDPLYERRELRRSVHIDARHLQRNIHASLLAQLRMKYEGVCIPEGFVQPRSITIVDHSLGRLSLIRGGLDYEVQFQCEICLPHPGQTFRAPVTLKSKIGLHAELLPMKVLLPRDLHIGNSDFDSVEESQQIEFTIVGSRFQQGDDSIVVLATMKEIVKPAGEPEFEGLPEEDVNVLPSAPSEDKSDEKRVVNVEVSATKATAGEPRRKRMMKLPTDTTNEPKP